MNIYKMNNDEITKAHNDFNKTAYGRRAKLFSIIPIFLAYVGFAAAIILMIADGISDIYGNGEDIFAGSGALILVVLLMAALNLSIGCIVQMQYGKMLNEFVSNKTKK